MEKNKKSKYGNKKTVIDGIEFDSKLEGKYYLYLKELKENKKIKDYDFQPKFELQPKFKKNGKAYRKIEYIADFEVIHNDNKKEIIDIKGFETADFKIKKKIFEFKYPELELKLLTYVKKRGGWITLEENNKCKRQEKKGVKK